MIRRPPRSTLSSSSAASDVYKRQVLKVWSLAPVGAGDRLDVVAPPPPGLQNEASDHPALHVQQLHPAVLEVSDLVGLAEVLIFDYLGRHCHESTSLLRGV